MWQRVNVGATVLNHSQKPFKTLKNKKFFQVTHRHGVDTADMVVYTAEIEL